MHRLAKLSAHLVGSPARGQPIQTPPWDLPPPKDTPPDLTPLTAEEADGLVPVRTTVSAEFQREFLLRTGISNAAFGTTLDPSFISSMLNAVITQGLMTPPHRKAARGHLPYKRKAGSFGSVHVADRLQLFRPLVPGEALKLVGGSTKNEDHPKGVMAHTLYHVFDSSGKEVLTVMRAGLELKPTDPATAARGSSPKAPEPDPRNGKQLVGFTQFTPDYVAGYCYFVTNRIHNEMETANEFGYRAPIWAGTQGMHLTMKHLYTFGVPQTLKAEFQFKRPVFWEDQIETYFGQMQGAVPGVGDYALVNAETGKLVMSMLVEEVTYQ